ncbi:enoyl-CoA hydratase-related protein [Novosphingobium album (ex Liu et al. 2023)]|uniref:Enoyl-CoA hydratase-related protein n=1 Tax=Novosphingobium album (ex Liu et al. 2023) TaxID=3031130 RepID=A0ABT5WTU6_9SPHN|nr:enoyl-CoA hydratase-related protein [Novosphingobium album (ex Liu et al. 2023)]MDE8653301.1 enoyl-CoA hydratase-related protein [Novosphingobium album (ex Liu et al. 2023)]
MTYERILYSLKDGVARIALNDPRTMNGVTEAMGHEMVDAFDRASREARAVLVTGEGKGFCSGANLADAVAMLDDPMRDVGGQLDRAFNPVLVAIKRMEQPVVTAIRGPAAGFGAGLAAAGDIVMLSDNAYFFCAFRHVGLVPDGGASYLLSKAVGRVRAMQMMLLGEKLPAEKALEWGLATMVVPDAELDDKAMAMAKELASGARSLGIIKRMAWDALDASFETALNIERRGQREAGRTEDFVEGIKAFGEKRKPQFKGR